MKFHVVKKTHCNFHAANQTIIQPEEPQRMSRYKYFSFLSQKMSETINQLSKQEQIVFQLIISPLTIKDIRLQGGTKPRRGTMSHSLSLS